MSIGVTGGRVVAMTVTAVPGSSNRDDHTEVPTAADRVVVPLCLTVTM